MGDLLGLTSRPGPPSVTGVRFGILGPLSATVDEGHPVDLGGPKQRELLAMLLIHLNEFVSAGRLVEALWNGGPPAGAEVTLRSHISHLRRRLGAMRAGDILVTRPAGYGLAVGAEQVDARRFERLLALGQEALGLGDSERAADLLRDALAQWRGSVLEDLGQPQFAAVETARLDELRLVAVEFRIEADLRLGRHRDLVAELERLVVDHPFRERLRGQLMLALYRSGRQVDALAAYSSGRRHLAEELGLDPTPALSDLETAILRHDPRLMLPEAPSPELVPSGHPGGRSETRPPPDALFEAARRVRMVGRAGELDRLRALWHVVRDGGRRVALVSGEAGMGKSRLVAELAYLAAEDGAVVLVGRCDPTAIVPYHPVSTAIRSSAEADELLDEAPEAIRRRLAPFLDGTPSPDGDAVAADDASDPRREQFDGFTWLLTHMAAAAPVVLVVEECERIDRASTLLLRHVVRRLPARVLVVISFRDPPGSRHDPLLELLGEIEGRGIADRLDLGPLSEGDVADLVADVAGAEAAPQLVRRLWRTTAGNPFYVAEILNDLRARDALDSDAAWQVPSSVRDVIRHRLRALPEPARQVVRAAAVLSQEAEFDLLFALVDQPEDLVVDSLEQAVAAGFLVESGRQWMGSYSFRHELTRDAVYGDIPIPRRQRLHVRAAQQLLSHGPSGGSAVTPAAVHMRAAGPAADPVRAAELSLQAADEAGRVYAWDEAVVHAEAAVEILRRVGAPPAQQADAAVRAAMLRVKSGIGYPRAVEHLEAALQNYRGLGDDAAVGMVHSRLGGALCTHHSVMDIPRAIEHFAAAERLLADPGSAFHLHRGQAQAAMYGLRTEILGSASQRANELATALARRDLTVMAGWGRAWFRLNRGELEEAWAILEEAWNTAHELGHPYLGWAPVNAAALAATEYLFDPATGRAWCRRGLAQARFDTFAHPHAAVLDQLVLALAAMGEMEAARRAAERLPEDAVSKRLLLFLDGEWEAAERSWAAALASDEAVGDLLDAALNARWVARARDALGRTADAVAALNRALALGVSAPQVPTELIVRAELARLLATEGDVAAAASHLTRCDEILGSGEDWRGVAGVVELARGALASAKGHRRRSDAAHEKALEIFATYHLPWRRADALHAWGRALMAAGRADEATARHRAASAAYDDLGAPDRWRRRLIGT